MPIIDKERVIGVQFGVFSPQEIIRRSVVRVTSSGTHEGNDPKIGGLFDPRMGVLDNNRVCPTDGKKARECPGQFGHYPLVRPVYYIQYLPLIIKVLKCVCPRCGKLLVDRDDPSIEHIMNMPRKTRASEIYQICSKVKRCGDLTLDGCGAEQPMKIEKVGMATISATWKSITNEDGTPQKQDQTVEQVLSILQRISDEDCRALGQSEKWGRPDWMICEVLPVAPPTLRPSIKQENNQRSEDDITYQQIEIIKADETLRAKIQSGARQEVIDDYHQVLQYHVATLADNDISGVAPSAHRLGRPLRCIAQRLGGKEGRIRANLMGKRVNFSARSVITGDPNISVEELGVPIKIAMNLTFPEKVNRHNIERLQGLVNAGPDQYPGAKTVYRASEDATYSLRVTKKRAMKLQIGDVVNRHLIDGDTVLFNRQPSLHRPSMMAHRVVVLPYNSFRLNVTVTPPQNADFDGDEMNAHIPQSELAVNELRQLAAVKNHLISARMNSPIIVPVQDTLLGVNRLTKGSFSFSARDAMNMLMHAQNFRRAVPTAALPGNRYTGQQLVETILPAISLHAKGVHINAGEYAEGTINKGVSNKIVHQIINDFGNDNAVKYLDALQRIVAHFLVLTGFSVGVSDLVADSKTRGEVDEAIRQKKSEVMRVMSEVHLGLMENKTGAPNEQVFEENVLGILNKANENAGNRALASLAENNRMTNMVKAGSKGNNLNIAQMTACLGQINVSGRRIQYGQEGRTLPHFRKQDDGPEARGFVESSFIEGLTPTEFFFHAISGREGLIDTAVKTSDTGYTQRQLIKSMEDLKVHYDGSVRNANGMIVQTIYGEDGLDPMKVETLKYPTAEMSISDILREYSYTPSEKMELYLEPKALRRAQTDKEIFDVIRQQTEKIVEDRDQFVESMRAMTDEAQIQVGVPISRIIERASDIFKTKETFSDATPRDVVDCFDRCLQSCTYPGKTHPMPAMEMLLRTFIHPAVLLRKWRLSQKALEWVHREIERKFLDSLANSGEMVGVVSAQSMGEPATQMTLNTFHMSGTSKANATRGVPRLKEIIHLSKNLKSPSLTIYLDDEHKRDQEKAEKVRNRTHRTLIRDLVAKTFIYFEPTADKVHPSDRQLIDTYRLFEEELATGPRSSSPWVLRFQLDPREMLERGISIEDIEFVLSKVLEGSAETIMGETLAQELVMRIRFNNTDFDTEKDAVDSLRELEKRILNTGVMGGVPGIDYAIMNKETNKHVEKNDQGDYDGAEEWVIITNGANFLGALQIDGIDPTKLISNDVVEIFNVLGIDAARNALIQELTELLLGEGAYVNPHHISLLCDNMTYRGRVLSVDRHGVSKSDIGPLGKASFEETEITLLRAASHGELDPVTGVSANIMFGQTIPGGTGMTRVAIDEDEMAVLAKQSHILREREEAKKRAATAVPVEEKQGADVLSGCAPERIQINDVGGPGEVVDRFAQGANELDDEEDFEFDDDEE